MTPEFDKDNQVTFGDLIKILRKQLQLLSERSETADDSTLAVLTSAMVDVFNALAHY